jgi:hypothetical protein
MKQLRIIVPAVAAAAICIAVLAAGGAFASGKAGATKTLRFFSVAEAPVTVPALPLDAPPQVGERLIFGQTLYNGAAQFGKPTGARVGRTVLVCTIVSPGESQCAGTAHVPDGQVEVMGALMLRRGTTTERFAVVGGVGAYGNARGTVTSRDISESKSVAVIRLSS